MSLLSSRIFWITTSCLLLASLLWSLNNPKIEVREKIVTKIQERVRTLTKIKVSPDGTKVTTIETVSQKDTSVSKDYTEKSGGKAWTVIATATSDEFPNLTPTYGVGVSRELALGLGAGVYATTDREFGLMLSYSF